MTEPRHIAPLDNVGTNRYKTYMNATTYNATANELTAHVGGMYLHRTYGGRKMRAVIRGEFIVFIGGKNGSHQLPANDPVERILTHWEGYCDNNGAGLRAGRYVGFYTGQYPRSAKILVTPSPTSKTVSVGGFRYKHGGKSQPRRVRKDHLRWVS
jgi:hypothetical protein